jgi:GAF domain-containing protein
VLPPEAVDFGLADAGECPAAWTFAHVPLAGAGRLVGAVTAASRSRTFTEDDLTVIERMARNRARQFDRRRRRR